MADDSHAAVPAGIDAVVSHLRELETVLGVAARPGLQAVQQALIEAMAARDRGDAGEATAKIGAAMDRLAGLAGQFDDAEATLMRALAERFRAALLRRDTGAARAAADVMFERSGSRWIEDGDKKRR